LLESFKKEHPNVPLIIDTDTHFVDAENGGDFDRAVLEGLEYDKEMGGKGWTELETQVQDETSVVGLAYTSGTTAKPKGVEYTHRGLYLAALANVIESGLNIEEHGHRAKYLWTLPLFHVSISSHSTYLLIMQGQRLDLSLERNQRPRHPLLSSQNRLCRDMATS
jgi:long-subunit acyl-CoA synthetase (AMP-forming)